MRLLQRALGWAFLAAGCGGLVHAQTLITWANSGTSDFTAGSSWVGGVAPGVAEIGFLTASVPAVQPTLATAYSVGGLRFAPGTGPFTLSGSGTLSLGATGIDNQSGAVQTISTALAFNVAGSAISNFGTLTISGSVANNSSSGLTLTGGGNSGAITGAISGSGALIKTGTGQWSLSGANTFSGGTVVNDGRLQLGASNTLPSSGNVVINANVAGRSATLDIGATTQTIAGLTFGGVGATSTSGTYLAISPGGSLTLGGNVVYDATNNPLAANISGGGVLELGANRTFIVGDSSTVFTDLSISTVIGGAGFGLTKSGAGTLTLSGANTYTGGTTVNEGRLQIAPGGSLAAGGNIVVNGLTANRTATFDANTSNIVIGNLTLGGAGGTSTSTNVMTSFTGGVVTLGGSVTFDATSNPFGGSLSGGGVLNLGSGTHLFIVGDSSAAPTDLNVSMTVTGPGGVSKTGAGTLTLNNTASNFTGSTSIQAGVLAVNSLSSLGFVSSLGAPSSAAAGTIAIGSGATGATLRYTGGSPAFTDRTIDLAGTTGGATLDITGPGSVTFQGPIIASGAGAKTLTLSGNSSQASTMAGAISDNSAVNTTAVKKVAFGTWVLSGANTYTGGTIVNGGVLRTGANGALPSGGDVAINASSGSNSASIDLAGTSQTIRALLFGGGGASTFGNNSLIIGPSAGAGQLTLGGNITFDATNNPGGAKISGGTLALGSASRTFVIGNSNNADSELTISSNVVGTGVGITKTGAGALTLNGINTYDGATLVTGGTLFLGTSTMLNTAGPGIANGPVGRGALTMQDGTTLAAWSSSFTATSTDVTIANDVSLGLNVTLGSGFSGESKLILSGTVTALNNTTAIHLGGSDIHVRGALNAANPGSTITFDALGGSFLNIVGLGGPVGSNIATLTASGTGIIFGTDTAIPGAGTSVQSSGGYIGVGATNWGLVPSAVALLARITDKAGFTGTFGFDTQRNGGAAAHVYSENLDFSGFGANFSVGSTSVAILTGKITPSAATGTYAFGNGGGALVVQSALDDAGGGSKSVSVVSSTTMGDNRLAVIFQGANTYTGNLAVTNSLAILDSPLALPAGRTASLGVNGYLGYTEQFSAGATSGAPVSFAGFASRVSTYTPSSILGFDSSNYIFNAINSASSGYTRVVKETIDLRAFNAVYIGTTTSAVFFGPILAPTVDGTLRLLSAGSGELLIRSALQAGAVNQVVLGSSTISGDDGFIRLNGDNTYAGGTTFLGGLFLLQTSSRLAANGSLVSGPLGTGTLTIPSGANNPVLATDSFDGTILDNALSLSARLQVGEQNMGGYGQVTLNGLISGPGGLDIYDDVALTGANTFSGGINFHNGALTLGSNTALGTGTLMISPSSGMSGSPFVDLIVGNGPRTINNAVNFSGFSSSGVELGIGGRDSLTLNGSVSLNTNTVTLRPQQFPVYLNGAVSGFGRLTVDGSSAVVLNPTTGTNTYSGGTQALQGAIIFASANAIPATPFTAFTTSFNGYIGLSFVPANLQSAFVDRFNKFGSSGTLGFDSPGTAPLTFTGNIDLTGFGSNARLGSATTAILSGVITPQDTNYHFGGGGGTLEVASALTGSRSVHVVSSAYDPLTAKFSGANTFAGGVFAQDSAVIFSPGALPAGTNNFSLTSGAYAGLQLSGSVNGTTDPAVTGFLAHFTAGSALGYLGFEASPDITVTDLDLSRFTAPAIAVATASNLTLAGNLTLTNSTTSYRFAGYKGGQLIVASALADAGAAARSVLIGDVNTPATFASPTSATGPLSSVTLSGNNTYTGGTTLDAGVLNLGSNTALGTAALTITSGIGNDDMKPGVFAAGGSRTLGNALIVGSELNIGGDFNLTLNGNISGSGELYKVGSSVLTLAGSNGAFTGGIYVAQGNVTLASATSAGTGPIHLGTTSAPSVTFSVSMLVNGISGDNAADQLYLGAGTVLTVNQIFDAHYQGHITGLSGSASVVYQGPSAASPTRLRLSGSSSYNGSTSINSGIIVVAGNNDAFGPASNTANAVSINGGKLTLESGVLLSNALTLNTGALGGVGTLMPPATLHVAGVSGNRMVLAPGLGTAGTLSFSNATLGATPVLSLDNGGAYHWQLLDATNAAGGWDVLDVTGTVNIAATAGSDPFTLKILPIGGLDLLTSVVNFNPNQAYSWNVLNATAITGFTGGGLAIDSSAMTGLINGGTFNLSLNGTNTSLLLNFTPSSVPEPSTYALMALGGTGVFYSVRRRRRVA